MSTLATRIEKEAGRPLTPLEIFDITAARESSLSRLLMLYISTGLVFMLLPGTFLGVWNLMAISSRRSADSVSPGWIQAHGHAQIFGWIGTFILGIGFYSIPKLRRMKSFKLWAVWLSWALWTSGVTLRWLTSVYQWHWRVLLPLSATLEVAAFVIFFRTVSGHRPQDSGKEKLDEFVLVVIAGSVGLLFTLLINFGAHLYLSLYGARPPNCRRISTSASSCSRHGVSSSRSFGDSARNGFPYFWIAAHPRACTVIGRRSKFRGGRYGICRLDRSGDVPAARRDDWRCVCAPTLRVTSSSSKNQGRTRELPGLCEVGVCVGANCRIPRNLGRLGRQLARNLGGLASRAHRWLSGDDGICGGAASASGILRNAIALQHQAYVPCDADSHGGVPAARQF